MPCDDSLLKECAGCWTRHPLGSMQRLFGAGPYCTECARSIRGIWMSRRSDVPAKGAAAQAPAAKQIKGRLWWNGKEWQPILKGDKPALKPK